MRPAGFGDKNGECFLDIERAKKIKFPLVAEDAVTTGVGGLADETVIGVGMGSDGVYVVKVSGLVGNDLTVNGGGG